MIKAIVLAAGQGTRLRPLTDDIPKTMVSVNGKPIIQYQMDCYERHNIDEVHIVAGYKESELKVLGAKKHINSHYNSTNMVASLYVLKELFDGSSDIIISYGDIIFDVVVLEKLLEQNHKQVSIAYDLNWLKLWSHRMDDPLSDAESFRLDKEGKVIELGKKVTNAKSVEGQYIGLIHVSSDFAKQFFELYESLSLSDELFDGKDFANMYMTTYLQMQIDQGVVIMGVPINGGWVEVDSVEDRDVYEDIIRSGEMKEICKILV